jgi:hypothetical protein
VESPVLERVAVSPLVNRGDAIVHVATVEDTNARLT